MPDFLTAVLVAALVLGVAAFSETSLGKNVGRFLPTPFWIYFFSIILGASGVFPASSPVFSWLGLYGLLVALFLLLIGAPVTQLARMGARASLSMVLATLTMMVACVLATFVLGKWLPGDAWKAVGALAATWIGGSANMIAVKEVLRMEDAALAPLIIVDTILSYTWMALLLIGAGWQSRFDRGARGDDDLSGLTELEKKSGESRGFQKWLRPLPAIALGLVVSYLVAAAGRKFAATNPFFSTTGWSVLFISIVAVVLALTPVRRIEKFQASRMGTLFLYGVLVSIAAKTRVEAVSAAPVYIALGIAILALHGAFLLVLGRILHLPLYLLSTASQANVGGMASAPIVAAAYRPGLAAIGVLMAILGTVIGTYLGAATGLASRWALKLLS